MYRGLKPHQFTPMLGVHKKLKVTENDAPRFSCFVVQERMSYPADIAIIIAGLYLAFRVSLRGAFFTGLAIGLDGTTTTIEITRGFNKSVFTWWCEMPNSGRLCTKSSTFSQRRTACRIIIT